MAARLAATLDPYYPATSDPLNRDLCDLLVFLKSPTVLAKTIALLKQPTAQAPARTGPTNVADLVNRNPHFGNDVLAAVVNPPDTQKISYVFSLRNLRERLDDGPTHFLLHLAARRASKARGPQLSEVLG